MRVAVRLSLPDEPGMLATAARNVADVGANVVGLEVLESTSGSAIDDLLIEVDGEGTLQTLCKSLGEIRGSQIEHVRILSSDSEERGLQVLSSAVSILETANPTAALTAFMGLSKQLFGAQWAALIDLESENMLQGNGEVPDPSFLLDLVKKARTEPISVWAGGCWVAVGELDMTHLAIGMGRAVRYRRRERRELELLLRVTDRMAKARSTAHD